MPRAMMIMLATSAWSGAAFAGTTADVLSPTQPEPPQICQTVVSAERGATPYKLCMTRAQWKAKEKADDKDANRLVCHYQENPGSRLRSYKVCLPASEWANQRLRERQAVEQIQMRSCVPGGGC